MNTNVHKNYQINDNMQCGDIFEFYIPPRAQNKISNFKNYMYILDYKEFTLYITITT